VNSTLGTALAADLSRVRAGISGDSRCVGDKLPDDLLAQGFACDTVSAICRTEDVTFRHTCRRCPASTATFTQVGIAVTSGRVQSILIHTPT
jgi:hypothetical protein